jgi:photosystem II stability/assembly factor-like uncharacterized protein
MLAAVLLLISALPSEVPVSAGVLSWSEETIPDTTGMMLAPGTDVSDLAVAGDNTTIYATDREADRLYKSTDTGASWVELAKPAGAAEPQLVAVAPDNINLVTIVADNSEVYISADGGAGCIFHE